MTKEEQDCEFAGMSDTIYFGHKVVVDGKVNPDFIEVDSIISHEARGPFIEEVNDNKGFRLVMDFNRQSLGAEQQEELRKLDAYPTEKDVLGVICFPKPEKIKRLPRKWIKAKNRAEVQLRAFGYVRDTKAWRKYCNWFIRYRHRNATKFVPKAMYDSFIQKLKNKEL